jgi:hypothetical protein
MSPHTISALLIFESMYDDGRCGIHDGREIISIIGTIVVVWILMQANNPCTKMVNVECI